MKYYDINPYVRFACIRKRPAQEQPVTALDHRILYCLSDKGEMEINGKLYNLTKGAVLFWKAGIPYRFIPCDETVIYLGCNFDFFYSNSALKIPIPPVLTRDFKKEQLTEHESVFENDFYPDCIFAPQMPLQYKFEEMIEEFTARELFFEERCSAMLKDILILLARQEISGQENPRASKTQKILDYIHEHYAENITNVNISERFSYHPNYVSLLVEKRTGMPLHKYLVNYRINRAQILLYTTNLSVCEVAFSVGFLDVKHFSKAFKKVTGISPGAYRKAAKQKI